MSVYTRVGSHIGVELDSSAWSFVGVQPVTVAPPGLTMTFDLPEAFPLLQGGTRAFMIASTSPGRASGLFLLSQKLAPGSNAATFQATDRSGRKSARARVIVVR